MTTSLPPAPSTLTACSRAGRRLVSSSLTAIRSAWKILNPVVSGRHFLYYSGELAGRLERPGPDDRLGDTPAIAFFAVTIKKICHLRFGVSVQNFSCRNRLLGAETHVQGRIVLETESPALRPKLQRGHPEVEENPIHRNKIVFVTNGFQVNEIIVYYKRRTVETGKCFFCLPYSRRVRFYAQQLAAGLAAVEDSGGVAPCAERTVDVAPARLDGHPFDRFLHQDRNMDCNLRHVIDFRALR